MPSSSRAVAGSSNADMAVKKTKFSLSRFLIGNLTSVSELP